MAEKRRLTIPTIILITIALAGGISLVFLLFSLQRELAEQRRVFREDSVWVASQVEREARIFRDYLYRYTVEEDSVEITEVKRRFDVLWSRIESMDKGDAGDIYLQLNGAPAALEEGRKMLRQVDQMLYDLKPEDTRARDSILSLLDPVIDQFFYIARHASEYTLTQQEQRRLSFDKTGNLTIILVASIFFSGAALFLILIRNQRFLDQLTENLEQKVNERTQELEESNQSLKMMSQAIEQSPVSVMICDIEGHIEYVNPTFVEISGYGYEEALGKNPRFIQSGITPESTYREMWQSVHADRVWKGEICNRKKSGELFWEQVSLSPIKDGVNKIVGYLAVKEDISQRKRYEEQLLKQANYDSLTGLPNRLLAMDRLKQSILHVQRRGGAVALLFIDLDNFKQINDTLGHDCGDIVLQNAAKRLADCLRDCDTAARFGGDEFLVILSELQTRNDVLPIVRRIVDAFSRSFTLEGHECCVTASIGASLCPDDSTHASQLLKYSDIAMYEAKRLGKNSYSFYGD